jgi:protein-tyrosine-phosphatase
MDSSGRDPAGHDRSEQGGLSLDQRLALTAARSWLRREFHGTVDPATIERVLYTSHDLFTADSAITRFLRTKRFAHQQLQALTRVEGHHTDSAPVVVFVSAHDDSCSPMALGFFQHLAADRALAWSGGSEPSNEIHPAVVAAMHERGINVAGAFPKPWTNQIIHAADLVITLGCDDICPVYPTRATSTGISTIPPAPASTPSATRSNGTSEPCSTTSPYPPAPERPTLHPALPYLARSLAREDRLFVVGSS